MAHIESLKNCEKCSQFKGMYSKSMVNCKRGNEVVVVICQPSAHNKGFKNGEMIVRCGNGNKY